MIGSLHLIGKQWKTIPEKKHTNQYNETKPLILARPIRHFNRKLQTVILVFSKSHRSTNEQSNILVNPQSFFINKTLQCFPPLFHENTIITVFKCKARFLNSFFATKNFFYRSKIDKLVSDAFFAVKDNETHTKHYYCKITICLFQT